MQKRTREIVALALLAMLGVGVAFAMGWYILVGHGWNVAASNIDDSIGQMDGYSIFLFEGTKEAPKRASSTNTRSSGQPSEDSRRSEASSPGEGAERNVTLDDLAASYREKGAAVFVLDPENASRYEDPLVVSKKGMRAGLFSLQVPARPAAARVDVKLLTRRDSDFIVMITDDRNILDTPIRGIDVIVCTYADAEPAGGRFNGSSYCVDCPYKGQVEAIIVSPSGVISSKTLE